MMKKSFWILLLMTMTVACLDEPDCYQLNNHIVGIAFKKLIDSTNDTITITAFGTLEPALLFSEDTTEVSRIFIPLNYFENETAYFFRDMDSVRILRLQYVSQAQFVSENCGEKFVLSELRVAEHAFDSVRLVNDFPTKDGSSIQIEIFQ